MPHYLELKQLLLCRRINTCSIGPTTQFIMEHLGLSKQQLNTPRYQYVNGAGTQTAGINFAGLSPRNNISC
jgi:hypothetical protein